ncbi:hypothetical protein [Croceicoccus estronivorus]|uniref:hypothetical protein n=1 Tax=Croceicoccus estronivorus TaxID=1172626 RepID=UPI000AFE527A|nr:hypothetical protein [Croceicoccus estronivorus]
MDLNELLFQHQVALINANESHQVAFKECHFASVRYYAERIRQRRGELGVSQYRPLVETPAAGESNA